MIVPSNDLIKKALTNSKDRRQNKLDYAQARMKKYGTTLTDELCHLEGFTVHKEYDPVEQDNFFICQPDDGTLKVNEGFYVVQAPASPPTNVN